MRSVGLKQRYPVIAARDEIFQYTASIVSIAVGNAAAAVVAAIRISRRVAREVPPVIIDPIPQAGIALGVSTQARPMSTSTRCAATSMATAEAIKYAALRGVLFLRKTCTRSTGWRYCATGMTELRTERLTLTGVVPEDAAFILELLNDPSWLANISDRGVRNLEDARAYIAERLSKSLWLVARDRSSDPVGIYGLVDREGLPHCDIAYAILSRYAGLGYATEGSAVLLHHAMDVVGHEVILAITKPNNVASRRVLEKIGLRFLRTIRLPRHDAHWALYTTQIEEAAGASGVGA